MEVKSDAIRSILHRNMECYVRTVTVLLVYAISRVQLFATPWTGAHKAPLSLGVSRQEYWNGLPFPPPGDLPNPGSEPTSPVALALAGRLFATEPPGRNKVC